MLFGDEAHKAVENHLEQCHIALWNEDIESPASAPFCGCLACEVREVLYAACPFIKKYITLKEKP